MSITSKKVFIDKIKEGLKLERYDEYKRKLYKLTNYKDIELTVAISLIKKLEAEGIVDSNWDVHINGL